MAKLQIDQNFFYPNGKKSEAYPGYLHIPFATDDLVINKKGSVIRVSTGMELKQTTTVKGYKTISVRVGEGNRTPALVHRLVAYMFVPVSLKNADKDRINLQVNHMDGNKGNNSSVNLEWTTAKENMDHAYEAGILESYIKRPVLVRDICTGEVSEFETIRECCKQLLLDKNMLYKHLNSELAAGRVVWENHVFKFKNDQPWPTLLAHQTDQTTLWRTPDVVVKNIQTNEIGLFLNLQTAAEFLGINLYKLRNHRHRKGAHVPFEDWLFYPLDRSYC